jgi:hypothetical protein
MRRIEYSRRREEASCGVRSELLNRRSGVRIPAPAPLFPRSPQNGLDDRQSLLRSILAVVQWVGRQW